jgi:hypothetical protein
MLLACAANAAALDWRTPFSEPQDSAAAAARSDEYAWRLFVALDWPADPVTRSADPSARFGAGAVVWETWQNAADVYLPGGATPSEWRDGHAAQRAGARPDAGRTVPAGESAAHRFETRSLKDLPNARHIVGGRMVPLEDQVASARRLTEIRMNRTTFEFIRAQGLYFVEGQMRAYARAGATGRPLSFPLGAKEIKAKWRMITPRERTRYHTVRVTLADGSSRLYGLTALHIASKDLPHWFWATFEQVDNPTLADNEGWQLPSRDRFACGSERPDCGRAPAGIGLEGTVWQYYRLRGTLTDYVDSAGRPQLLANSELESGMQRSASCITCHARSALAVSGGEPRRLAVFARAEAAPAPGNATLGDATLGDATLGDATLGNPAPPDPLTRRGYVGEPRAEWFGGAGDALAPFRQLDFVWSLAKAQWREPPASRPGGSE